MLESHYSPLSVATVLLAEIQAPVLLAGINTQIHALQAPFVQQNIASYTLIVLAGSWPLGLMKSQDRCDVPEHSRALFGKQYSRYGDFRNKGGLLSPMFLPFSILKNLNRNIHSSLLLHRFS